MVHHDKRGKRLAKPFKVKGKKMWRVPVELPPKDGKRQRKWITGRTRAEVEAKRDAILRDARPQDLTSKSITVTEWSTRWLQQVESRVSPKTHSGYRAHVTHHINPAIGTTPIDKLAKKHVDDLRNHYRDTGCSGTTARNGHRCLSVMLRDAVREGLTHRNVADTQHSAAPRSDTRERQMPTAEEAHRLLEAINASPFRPRWLVSLLTGARRGEAIGLEWDRVDLEAKTLDISWQLQQITPRHGCETPCGYTRASHCTSPVTPMPDGMDARHVDGALWLVRPKWGSRRVVPMAQPLHEAMLDYAEGADRSGLVWRSPTGGIHRPSKDAEAWRAVREAAELPDLHLHDLRHMLGTLLLEAGTDPRVTMAIMGHSTAAMSRHYQHVDQTLATAALDGVAAKLNT